MRDGLEIMISHDGGPRDGIKLLFRLPFTAAKRTFDAGFLDV